MVVKTYLTKNEPKTEEETVKAYLVRMYNFTKATAKVGTLEEVEASLYYNTNEVYYPTSWKRYQNLLFDVAFSLGTEESVKVALKLRDYVEEFDLVNPIGATSCNKLAREFIPLLNAVMDLEGVETVEIVGRN